MRNDQDTGTDTTEKRFVEIEIRTKRWGSDKTPSVKAVKAPMVGESRVSLEITIDLRKADTIELRPIRRDLDDVDGLVADAERLANNQL